MIVVPVRVVILHRIPISTHSHFYKPLYIPKTLQILQILQILQSYRHLTNVQAAQGPRDFFVHLAQVTASLRSAGAGKSCGGLPRLHVFCVSAWKSSNFMGRKNLLKSARPLGTEAKSVLWLGTVCNGRNKVGMPRRRVAASPLYPIPTKGHVSRLALLIPAVRSSV